MEVGRPSGGGALYSMLSSEVFFLCYLWFFEIEEGSSPYVAQAGVRLVSAVLTSLILGL